MRHQWRDALQCATPAGHEGLDASNDCLLSRVDASRHLRLLKFDKRGLIQRNPVLLFVVFHWALIITLLSLLMRFFLRSFFECSTSNRQSASVWSSKANLGANYRAWPIENDIAAVLIFPKWKMLFRRRCSQWLWKIQSPS